MQEFELVHAAEVADRHDGVQQGHALVLEQFGVDAPEIRLFELAVDETDGVAAGGEEHLAAGLVRLRFDRGALVVRQALRFDVVGHMVEAVGQPGVDFAPLRDGGDFETVAGDPVGVVVGAEVRADAEGAFDLLRGELAEFGIRIAEAAVAEDLVAVEAAGHRVELDAGAVEDGFDLTEDLAGFAVRIQIVVRIRGIPRHEVVVVRAGGFDEAFAGSPGEDFCDFDRADLVKDGASERVGQRVANAPEGH